MTDAVPADLLALAPADLPFRRTTRFTGGGFEVPLAVFGADDRRRLGELYAAVKGLADAWQAGGGRPDDPRVRAYLLAVDPARLVREAAALTGTPDPAVRKLLHDVRGGGLALLVGAAELARMGADDPPLVRGAAVAARDHAKIMRSGFPDLDPARYAADEADRVHYADGLVAGWDGLAVRRGDRAVGVEVRCRYAGPITSRCLEASALGRVVYNYLNNAVRFAADGRVRVWVFAAAPGMVRWVVENRIGPADRDWLAREVGGDPRALFAGGRTRGGHGIGLANCAELVAACFGVTPADAVRDGHLGAAVAGDAYRAWFHWPMADPADPARVESSPG